MPLPFGVGLGLSSSLFLPGALPLLPGPSPLWPGALPLLPGTPESCLPGALPLLPGALLPLPLPLPAAATPAGSTAAAMTKMNSSSASSELPAERGLLLNPNAIAAIIGSRGTMLRAAIKLAGELCASVINCQQAVKLAVRGQDGSGCEALPVRPSIRAALFAAVPVR